MKRRSFKLISVAAIVLIAMLALTRAALAVTYTFITIDGPKKVSNAHVTMASGINDSGVIVGTYLDSTYSRTLGFRYNGITYSSLDDPNAYGNQPSDGTFASQMNNNGDIVGYYTDSSGYMHGFLYDGKTFTNIDDPDGYHYTRATGINNKGYIVGDYHDTNGNTHGFRYNESTNTYERIDYPTAVGFTAAASINDSGYIVGQYRDSSGNTHGFLYDGSTYTKLDNPNGVNTWAYGINNLGHIVGSYLDSSGYAHGFLAIFTGPGSINYSTIDDPNGVGITYVNGINDNGDIVGGYEDSSGINIHGFLASTAGGWYYLSWFGSFNANSSSWIYHETLGWLYPVGTSTDDIWFYDPQWDGHGGWWWTSSSLFPWVYSATEKEWLFYDAADSTHGARWFFTSGGQPSTH